MTLPLLLAGCSNLSGKAGSGLDYGQPYSAQNDGSRDVESYGFGGNDLGGAAGAAAEVHGDAEAMLELINEARCAAGAAPLGLNPSLSEVAAAHTLDMISREYADHTSPEGAEPGDRLTAAGYDWSAVGETLAFGAADAQAAFEGWMESEGHRAIVLDPAYREMGSGHASAQGTERTHYWTVIFAVPADGDATPPISCGSD